MYTEDVFLVLSECASFTLFIMGASSLKRFSYHNRNNSSLASVWFFCQSIVYMVYVWMSMYSSIVCGYILDKLVSNWSVHYTSHSWLGATWATNNTVDGCDWSECAPSWVWNLIYCVVKFKFILCLVPWPCQKSCGRRYENRKVATIKLDLHLVVEYSILVVSPISHD